MLKKSKNKSRGRKNLIAYRHKKLLQLGKYSFKGVTMRHFFANLVCAFIPKRTLRNKVRTLLYYPVTRDYIGFVRNYARSHNMQKCKIKINVGWGCSNLIVILNNECVFKFPLKNDGKELAMREKRITDALRPISPVKIPKMEIIPYKDIAVKKYEFAYGTLFSELPPSEVAKNVHHLAGQLAKFLYVLAKADPQELNDLKPENATAPGFLYGWNHGDIWQNFMVDPKTFDLTFFIDWEYARFGSLYPCVCVANHYWTRFDCRGLAIYTMAEYAKLYYGRKNNK